MKTATHKPELTTDSTTLKRLERIIFDMTPAHLSTDKAEQQAALLAPHIAESIEQALRSMNPTPKQ